MNVELNSEKVLELLKDFYTLTGVRICLFDVSFKELLSYPSERAEHCRLLRTNDAINKKCDESDRVALETAKKNGGIYIYKCHAGFTEAVCPIKYENVILGYLMFGHIRDNDPLKTFFKQQINSAAKIMESCACYIYLSRLIKYRNDSLEEKLNRHINDNIDKNLSVESLCRFLKISRVSLYSLCNYLYAKSPAAHIKQMRLNKACTLLKDTDKKISAIADECGFTDYNYFSKVFTREFHTSPGRYRKNT